MYYTKLPIYFVFGNLLGSQKDMTVLEENAGKIVIF